MKWLRALLTLVLPAALAIVAFYAVGSFRARDAGIAASIAPSAGSTGVAAFPGNATADPYPAANPTPDTTGNPNPTASPDDFTLTGVGPRATPTPSLTDWLAKRERAVTAAVRDRRQLPFAHNRPTTLPYDKATKIVLSIGSADMAQAIARVEPAAGPTRLAAAPLAAYVRAELAGPDTKVKIQPVGPAVRSISGASNTTWEWYVTPLSIENVDLTLSLFNQYLVDGQPVETEGPVYTDTFQVNATLWQKLLAVLNSTAGLLTVLGTSLVGIGGGAWKAYGHFRKKRKPAPAKAKSRTPRRP